MDLKKLIFSSTSQDSLLLLSGNVISTILNFALVIILTRSLSTGDFGFFITGLTFVTLLTDGFELGINQAVLNFLPSSEKKERIIKSSFLIKLVVGLTVGLLVFLLSGPITNLIFKNYQMLPIIQASSLGVILLMVIFWGQSVFQSQKRFFDSAAINTSINILRTIFLSLMILVGILDAGKLYLAAQVVLIGSVGYLFWKLRYRFLSTKITSDDLSRILKFGLPVGIGFSLAVMYTKLDQIMVFNMVGANEAGIYGLALRLSIVFVFASSALSSAFIPRFSSLKGQEFYDYFNKTLLISVIMGLASLAAIPISAIFIPIIFGSKFISSIIPFQILTLAMIFFILSSPFYSAIIFYFKKSVFSFVNGAISLVLIWVLLQYLIPSFGSVGAAIAVALVYLIQLFMSINYFYILKRS